MINKKTLPLALALAGLTSTAFAANHAPTSGAFDSVVANEQKLIEMLQKSGKISKNASISDAEAALGSYLAERNKAARANAAILNASSTSLFAKDEDVKKGKKESKADKGKGKKLGKGKKPENIVMENYTGETRTAKVLAILMEFPDFPHNSINPEDTGMYYEDYNQAHYQEILFGDNGWVAPNGHHARSFKQYYEAQSGGSYSTSGNVAGWYMASRPAAYYGNNDNGDARALVREALTAASADPTVNLADYDIEDRFDLDGDGNFWEPDGLVDHIMIFHSSVGEEAGGGQLGEDAIWAHRWNLGGVYPTTTPTDVPYWGGVMGAYDYTIAPIDAAVGVISHEYGHDLGLPDEYDTQYTGRGEPVSSWSVMSSGSWAGRLGGTEPTGFSAWAKEFLQGSLGGNWQQAGLVEFDEINSSGVIGLLDRASSKGTNLDAIRVNLPPKSTHVITPTSGEYAYFGGSADDLNNIMYTNVDLTAATSSSVKFKTWYDIETDWDYAYISVQNAVTGDVTMVEGNISTTDDPYGINQGFGITGNSNGWIDAEFDLSGFAGQNIYLIVNYITDGAVSNPGIYIDDLTIEVDGAVVAQGNADTSEEIFGLDGFSINNGNNTTEHYYLLEWRTHHGIDSGLEHITMNGQSMMYEEGLLVWYVDNKFSENWVGIHPGDGFLGVVDADQTPVMYSDGTAASTRFQIHDATFKKDKGDKLFIDMMDLWGVNVIDKDRKKHLTFDDSKSFIGTDIPDAGRNITNYGVKFTVTNQSKDRSVGVVSIYK